MAGSLPKPHLDMTSDLQGTRTARVALVGVRVGSLQPPEKRDGNRPSEVTDPLRAEPQVGTSGRRAGSETSSVLSDLKGWELPPWAARPSVTFTGSQAQAQVQGSARPSSGSPRRTPEEGLTGDPRGRGWGAHEGFHPQQQP